MHGHSYQTTGIGLAVLDILSASYFKDVRALVCVWVFAHLFLYLPTENYLLISVVWVCVCECERKRARESLRV